MIEFKRWPKIPRIENETYTVTEKIDGTNACVVIDAEGNVGAQARNGLIHPNTKKDKQRDNLGFAAWTEANADDLRRLGEGHHYGEWWGIGINRAYGLDHRRFSLFSWWTPDELMPKCCYRVPVLAQKVSLAEVCELVVPGLKEHGSVAAEGFMRPEGLVLRSTAHGGLFKVIIDK
jgi:hypothetical protein